MNNLQNQPPAQDNKGEKPAPAVVKELEKKLVEKKTSTTPTNKENEKK